MAGHGVVGVGEGQPVTCWRACARVTRRLAAVRSVASPLALGCGMGKYLAIFHGAATKEQRQDLSTEDSQRFVERWAGWAGQLGRALIDPGAPLFRKVRLTADTAAAFEDSKTGYAIVQAESQEEAVRMFATHPHLDLTSGNSIEVIECPDPPT